MKSSKPNVLVISDLFPNSARPVEGIFVQYQCKYLRPYVNQVVVVPYRVFPHLRLWKNFPQPHKMNADWRKWISEIKQVPRYAEIDKLPVYYPRYTSLPKQIFHSTWGFFAYTSIHPLLRQLNQKYTFDLIHAHYASPAGVLGLLIQQWMHKPLVLSIHGFDLSYTLNQKPLGKRIIPWVLGHADAVLANSTKTANQLKQARVTEERLHLVRLGANPPPNIIKTIARLDHTIHILTVGRLYKQKGHIFVLQAMADLVYQGYDLHYTIVGDGPEDTALRTFVSQNGLDGRVSFIGYLPHKQVWSHYAACDLFVLPSWNEAFGLVYIEALSLKKPVIGCIGEGGPDDLYSLGDCIKLVKPRDVVSLRAAIQKLLDDPEQRITMGELGSQIVAQYYTWEKTAEHTAQIYDRVLREWT